MYAIRARAAIGDFQTASDFPLLMSYFSHIAYHRLDRVVTTLRRDGALSVKVYDMGDTQSYLAEFENYAVLVFRGTQGWKDLWTNLQFWKTEYRGMRLHKGFVRAFQKVEHLLEDDLLDIVRRGKKLVYGGHSLGGALAQLACSLVKPDALYIFGSPSIGSKADAIFTEVDYFRIEHREDWVPLLPPTLWGFRRYGKAFKYWCGTFNPFKAHDTGLYMETMKAFSSKIH